MSARSRSQKTVRAPRRAAQTNLKLIHGDGERPQVIGPTRRPPLVEWPSPRIANLLSPPPPPPCVTSSNQRYDEMTTTTTTTRRRRRRTTTVYLRVEGPTTTTTTTTTNLRRRMNGGQPFGYILLPLIAATFTATLLALVSVQTFAFASVHSTNELQQPPVLGHPQQQQVDARLIPQVNKKSDVDGDAAQREKIHWATNERATLVKRSNADQLSSAELPAEFRGGAGDEQPREQSRLARLCQQTSSVLASVLPAPFGGHKRSILCQFFGQVQVGGKSATGKQMSVSRPQTPQTQSVAAATHQYPMPGVSLPSRLQFPVGGPQFEPAQESIAILHQHQQPPVAMLATGKHPIQMVLEHQQRQAAAVANQMSTGWSRQLLQDLNVESSIQDQRVSLQEFAEPPPQKQIKFSAPLATSPAAADSSVASSPQISSSGWRISNGTSLKHETPSSSTTPMPRVNQTSATPTSEPKTGAVQLSIGKRTSETAQRSTPAAVRIQPSTSAAKSKETEGDRVRTIEVSAEEVAAPESPVSRQAQESGPNSAARPSDARQVQKREELVIASINNLTRIAFGNQLRDTVKVINKLIDQQAAVFGQPQPGDLVAAASAPSQQDPMLTSESVSKPQATLMMIPSRLGDKTQDPLKATAAVAKLSSNSNKASEHGKVTLTSSKLNSSSSSSGSAGPARDNLKTTAVRSQRQQQRQQQAASVASESKLGQRTGNNNINNKLGEGGAEQFTTRQERISSSAATNKLRSTTGAASKLATGLPKMATSVAGQKSASASNKKVTQSPAPKKQQAVGGSTRTSPKSSKEFTQRKATNHLQRTTAKFSQGDSGSVGTSRNKDRKQQQDQSSTASVELRRLTTIGRALLMQNDGQHSSTATATTPTSSKQARAIEGSRKSNNEMDLAVAQTINDPTRPVTSTWLPSRGPVGSATTPTRLGSSSTLVMRKLHKIKESSHDELESRRHAPAGWTSTSLAAPSSWSQAQSLTVTQFPWLLPDKSALASSESADLFSASSNLVSPTEMRAVKPVDAHQQFGASSQTTRRMVTPYGSDQFSSAFTGSSSGSSKHTPLVLNRIDTTRPDSLTTLKMALTRARATSTPQPPETTTPTRATRLPFSAGTTQSRWLPSTALLARQPVTTTTTAAPTPAAASLSSSSPAMAPSGSSTFEIIANSYGSPSTVAVSASSANDLDETRASETISKYTTHLSDQAANEELITTAAKRGHFQQPLPQIANTGDYFNAETIASWPEKYHTMVSQAMSSAASQPTARTTANFETTRRNGETYETPAESSAAAHTTLSRHRLDAKSTQAVGETTRLVDLPMGVISSNAPGITILPANHKLMASSATTESELSSVHDSHLSTRPMDTPSSTEPPQSQTKQPLAPYTLPRDSAMTAGSNSSFQEEISQTTTGDMMAQTNSTSGSDPMRPPYQTNYDFNFQQLSDPTLVLDQNQSRPYVSKKLYELLAPSGSSSQSFAGAAHPARSQRFNWSALKYLAQNLLMATQGRQHNETNMSQNHTVNSLTSKDEDDDDESGANDTEQQQQVASKTDQQQLYDLMTRSSLPPLSDYYELAGNESARGVMHQLQEPANQLNQTYQGKGLFERASNLLSDMKQLEQKRAAALMAALRYQVPGPLIKPWDPLTQAAHHSSASISKFFSDRLDNVTGSGRAAATSGGSLSPTQLLNALKSALFKQKLVARDELEARLKSGRRVDQISPERRGGDDMGPQLRSGEKQIELSLDDSLSPPGNSSMTLDDLEYILTAANETAIGQDAAMDPGSSSSSSNSTTLLKTMLARLFSSANSSSYSTNSSSQPESDFHLIDLSTNDAKVQTTEASRPKYIRLLDYQTALTRKPLDDKARRMFAPSGGGSSGGGSRQAMAEVIARLRTPATGAATTVTEASIEFERGNGASKGQAAAAASESDQDKPATDFDCEGRSAGFYPDASSLCRTFYHCSNTGHLLTFNCPTSTRFDEKSLKCGPWYEVSCDIGRVRTRRY